MSVWSVWPPPAQWHCLFPHMPAGRNHITVTRLRTPLSAPGPARLPRRPGWESRFLRMWSGWWCVSRSFLPFNQSQLLLCRHSALVLLHCSRSDNSGGTRSSILSFLMTGLSASKGGRSMPCEHFPTESSGVPRYVVSESVRSGYGGFLAWAHWSAWGLSSGLWLGICGST